MLWNSYVRMLKRLNPAITFHESTANNYATVGVYLMQDDPAWFETNDPTVPRQRATFLFGASRDWVPDRTEQGANGEVVRRGWKDSIVDLYQRGFVKDREYYRSLTQGWRPHFLP